MNRTTVKLPEEVDARLRHEAARRGVTVSDLTRDAIEAYLGFGARRQLAGGRTWQSGYDDTSERIEEILRREAAR